MVRLLLIDGNAVLHRAYYAMPDWRNRSGEATAGVYGFLSMLLKAIDELKPTHLAVVFDSPEPTFRHVMYVGYQATREKERQVSEDIWGQVEKLKVVFEKLEVPVFAVPGYEADDVIGTLARQWKTKKGKCTIITGDRDLMQLVDKQVVLYMPQKGLSDAVIVDEDQVMEKLGIHPAQVIDYKGLVGDSSDNYPGAAGIGPKTAIHLLAEFGTLDNIYKNLQKVNEKIGLKLAEGFEAAKLSQKLATIKLDVPMTLNIENCTLPTTQKFADVLKGLGYKSLVRRLGGEENGGVKDSKMQKSLFE